MNFAILVILAVLAVCAAADETEEEPVPISEVSGLEIISFCPGDEALVRVIPIPTNAARVGGLLITTNSVLTLNELSMLPPGLNRLEIQTIRNGLTGAVTSVVVDIQIPPPAPMVVPRLLNVRKSGPLKLAGESPPLPPMPPSFVPPLPNASTNKISYHDAQLMKNYYSRRRRN